MWNDAFAKATRMLRLLTLFSVLLAVGCSVEEGPSVGDTVAGQAEDGLQAPLSIGPIGNCHDREAVLFFDVSGGTLGGPVHRRLSVYADGYASVSKEDRNGADAAWAIVGTAAVGGLQARLLGAGASALHDCCEDVPDFPLTTVSFFSGPDPPVSVSTFSYFLAEGVWAETDQIINAFIQEYFPGF